MMMTQWNFDMYTFIKPLERFLSAGHEIPNEIIDEVRSIKNGGFPYLLEPASAQLKRGL